MFVPVLVPHFALHTMESCMYVTLFSSICFYVKKTQRIEYSASGPANINTHIRMIFSPLCFVDRLMNENCIV